MKGLFGIGIALLLLGLISLVVPLPHRETRGIKAGDISVDIHTQHSELIGAGLVMTLAGTVRR